MFGEEKAKHRNGACSEEGLSHSVFLASRVSSSPTLSSFIALLWFYFWMGMGRKGERKELYSVALLDERATVGVAIAVAIS